jgi:Fe-S cluster biogenesis protein NfuA
MSKVSKAELEQRALAALEQIRPFLEEDGGDIALKEITDDFVVKVELLGTCTNCSMNTMTFKAGVKDAILKAVPEIKDVEAVNFALNG